jgi:hypothetical protein
MSHFGNSVAENVKTVAGDSRLLYTLKTIPG